MAKKRNNMAQDFVKVKCKCKNEQIIFKRASSRINCLVCNELIAEPTGGNVNIKAEVVDKKVS